MSSSSYSESSSSEDEETEALRYRFSGYQLYLVQYDATGPAYAVTNVHPYYKNQPFYWTKPYQTGAYWNTTPRCLPVSSSTTPSRQMKFKQSKSAPKESKSIKNNDVPKNDKNKIYPFRKLK